MDVKVRSQWRLVLPSTWWTISLESEEGDRRAVREHLRHIMPDGDSVNALRRDLETQLRDQARTARAAGGIALILAEELVPGVRLGGSLLLTHLPLFDPAPDRLLAVLKASDPSPESVSPFECVGGLGARSIARRTQTTENSELTSLCVDYAVAVEGMSGAYLLSFSVPVAPAWESAVLTLVDTIAQGFHLEEQQAIHRKGTRRG